MKNYVLMRFVKLNIYFFAMYGTLTCIWYGITDRFNENSDLVFREIMVTSAFFSLAFSIMVLTWYSRTSIRIPVKSISKKELQQKVEATGYGKVALKEKQPVQVYKPVPPRASAMAGKIFIHQDINFYNLTGPKRFLKLIIGEE